MEGSMSRYELRNNGHIVAYGYDHMGCGYFVQVIDEYDTLLLDKDTLFDDLTGPDLHEELHALGVTADVPLAHALAMVNGRRF